MMNRREFAARAGRVRMDGAELLRRSPARMSGLDIGVIGCGGMAGVHMNRLLKFGEKTDNFQFTAVCDLYDKRRDAAAHVDGRKAVHPLPRSAGGRRTSTTS